MQNKMEIDGTSSSEDLSLISGVGYIDHPVSKFDTLAGIAIKYGVEVSDIKRMNALVTDHQMFALKSLQIPTPGRHPSPHLSEDLDFSRKDNCEQDSCRLTSFNLLDSFQSLRIKSSTFKSPLQLSQPNIPTICDMNGYRKGEFVHLGPHHPMLASSPNPLGSRHRKSRSFANGFPFENVEFTDVITVPNGATNDSIKMGEMLVRRRQKSMADFSTATECISNKTYINSNNAASNGVAEVSKLTINSTEDVGGDTFMSNGIVVGKRSSSTCNLQEAEKGNSSSSSSTSMWSTSSWSLKTDLQALSSAMVTKSTSTRYKASMD